LLKGLRTEFKVGNLSIHVFKKIKLNMFLHCSARAWVLPPTPPHLQAGARYFAVSDCRWTTVVRVAARTGFTATLPRLGCSCWWLPPQIRSSRVWTGSTRGRGASVQVCRDAGRTTG